MPRIALDSQSIAGVLADATGLQLTGQRPHVRLPQGICVQRLQLRLAGDGIVLLTWPAELKDQARAFYGDSSRVARVLDLISEGAWQGRPNGHLSYWLAAPDRRWYFADGALALTDYMRQWQVDLNEVHSYPRDEVPSELWPWLLRRGYAGERDRPRMEEFIAGARPDVHLRPGVCLSRRWSVDETQRGLTRAVRVAVDEVLDTLAERPLTG